MGNLSPLGVSLKKTVHFQGKLFTASFLQAAVASPILGIDFLRKFKVIVVPEINQIQFACAAAASPAPFLPSDPLASFVKLNTSPSSGSNPAAHCDEFFIASCHIRTCSPESQGEVVQL
jgi:hypothetical protein